MQKSKKFFFSLRWEIAVTYLFIIGLTFIIINISIMKILENRIIHDKEVAFQKYAIQVAQTIADDYFNKDPDVIYKIQELGEKITKEEGGPTRILVLNESGVVDYDSYNDIGPKSLLKKNLKDDFPEIKLVLEGNFIPARDLYIYTGTPPVRKRVLYSFASITHSSGRIIGMVILSTSLANVEEVLTGTQRIFNIYLAIISMSIIFISLIISGFITRPINELTRVIEKMSEGHLNQRVDIKGSSELRRLGEAFNIMCEKLENLDRARSEFVSNASHELKTPLSSIKVLTESLLHMQSYNPDIFKEFLSDINKEIDRLNAIITDLLTLVQIDNQDIKLRKELVNIAEVTEKTAKRLEPLAAAKDITLELNLDRSLTIRGDEMKLQQVLTNIIDNAIKYTPDGGRVTIESYKRGGNAVIKVADTGIGIPKEALPYIFDRFYRVDKARSRATGGTGLGLSIAKKIVLLHNGNIRVESQEGKGSNFYIELPLNR